MENNSKMSLANLNISKIRIKKIIKHFENISILTGNRKVDDFAVQEVISGILDFENEK